MKQILPRVLRAAAAAALVVLGAGAQAQGAFPTRPITLIVPFAPGASADGIARIVARDLSASLGQPVVVENKPGAGGATGLIQVSKSVPDGHVIGLGATGAIVVNPNLPEPSALKPQTDLATVAKLADIPLVLVAGSKAGYANLRDFLEKARSSPGGVNMGNSGQYTSQHLAGELLADMGKVKTVAVPYRGSGPAVTDLLGGQLPLAVVDLTSAYPHIKAGTLRALGVTSAARTKVAPEIPTIAEAGVPGYSADGWMGLFAPAQTPPAVLERLAQAVREAMGKPEVQAQIVALSAEPAYLAPAAFSGYIAAESTKWAAVIKTIPAPPK
ncbi:MAG: tripartite tricarboxylate transporter substrate binding protein [Comamonadaceae bacterium]|nr:MAG: tripartite tricarboxylate transporter substrate binding protein [Comamonadaceae bacterium]